MMHTTTRGESVIFGRLVQSDDSEHLRDGFWMIEARLFKDGADQGFVDIYITDCDGREFRHRRPTRHEVIGAMERRLGWCLAGWDHQTVDHLMASLDERKLQIFRAEAGREVYWCFSSWDNDLGVWTQAIFTSAKGLKDALRI